MSTSKVNLDYHTLTRLNDEVNDIKQVIEIQRQKVERNISCLLYVDKGKPSRDIHISEISIINSDIDKNVSSLQANVSEVQRLITENGVVFLLKELSKTIVSNFRSNSSRRKRKDSTGDRETICRGIDTN